MRWLDMLRLLIDELSSDSVGRVGARSPSEGIATVES